MSTQEKVSLSPEQESVYRLLETTNDNYFITGKAGTGKSVLLRHFIANTKKSVAVVAPTGIAAINVQGQTIHSFFGLSPSLQVTDSEDAIYKNLSKQKIQLMSALQALVIDEISMVRVDVMDMIDAKLRAARKSQEPFGGCQIIAFGDLYQLPPIVTKEENVQKYLSDKYHTIFFFGAPACINKPFVVKELKTVFRQKDQTFVNILNEVRVGAATETDIETLNTRYQTRMPSDEIITLTPTNSQAQKINEEKLASLSTPEVSFEGVVTGNFQKADLPVDYMLRLKEGAQIMMVKNDKNGRWVNGTLGRISELDHDYIAVAIHGHSYSLNQEKWEKYEYRTDEKHPGKLVQITTGTYSQYPLKLAYAITIHKSQGQTYDSVVIDYSDSRAFAEGQTYVALSRCRSMDSMYLTSRLSLSDIRVNQEVIHFINSTLKLPKVAHPKIPDPPKSIAKEFPAQEREDGCFQIDPSLPHKKITGRRFASILGEDPYATPFKTWCEIMRVYEEPFTENKFTKAGQIIEPKQYNFIKDFFSHREGCQTVSPEDMFGADPKASTSYDFFNYHDIFGGMWDYLVKRDGKIVGVLEMKTKQAKKRGQIEHQYPVQDVLQAILYAKLLGIDSICMVTSFLDEDDYISPEDYVCTPDNTTQLYIKVNPGNEQIEQAEKWWRNHVVTGISPKPDPVKDAKLVNLLRTERNPATVIRCPSCGSIDSEDHKTYWRCNHCGTNFVVTKDDQVYDEDTYWDLKYRNKL